MSNNIRKRIGKIISFRFAAFYRLYASLVRGNIERKADVIIFSFPKSGRTWLRLLLAKYFSLIYNIPLSLELFDMARISDKVPKILFTHDVHIKYSQGRRILDIGRYNNKKIALLVRDPRDTIVSYFFQTTKRQISLKNEDINNFIIKYYSRLIDYMNLFAPYIDNRIYLVRYEDLTEGPGREVYKILNYIGVQDIQHNILMESVEFCRFENMKHLERTGKLDDLRLQPGRIEDPDSYKVRRGVVGGYKDYLSTDMIGFLNNGMKGLDKKFGYKN